MQTVTFRSRAVAVAVSAAAIAFIVALVVGTAAWGSARDMAYALVVALLCGSVSWAAAQRSMAGFARSINRATARLVAAAHGDLQTPVQPGVRQDLPDLAIAMDSLFSQVRANLDNIHLLAMFDPVTGLPNRMSFCRQVDRLLAERHAPEPAALFFLDLDGFKGVNDTLGHAAGDQLLARVAGRLREVVITQVQAGSGDAVVGRLAGDEFTLFFPDIPDRAAAERIARAIQFALGEPFDLGGQQIVLGASIGIAYHPDHGVTLSDLLRAADIAMYHAKNSGRGRAETFNADLARKAAGKEALERDLRAGLERGEFLLQFQPQIDVVANRAIVAEALVRWAHPERDMLFPATFVHVAEASGVIVELGDWIMDQVCETAARWARDGLAQRVAINISMRELSQADFFLRLRHAMTRHGTPPGAIELEITESMAMDMDARLRDQLQALRDSGVRIAIDDFGTGYSNLARLRDLPIDRVKIDSSLVRNIETSAEARIICSAVVALIQGLGLDVVIEGVETAGQVDILRVIGCTVFQGYHLAHPAHEPDYIARFGPAASSVLEA
ncbi:putative bifunctional diguanylate cyclase/phosphodiesterase [Sphingobium algorifonticola]|uniref:EAL domain-containing protein n=1 Tax=Sphingobium algorifonticola TaxID=2008318 RepID=A0A437J8I0_9SPHN|nr:EAL domain-containing protein [Sphingobium algorifonticola]RVT41809.1 EAL domain-containing protein [Sphingobium algorifonticola]